MTDITHNEIKITLQKIRDNDPCVSGWRLVFDAHKHIGMDTEFPLSSVLESNDNVLDTIWCMRCLPEYDNLWRKFAVWCARRVEHLLTDERSRNALNVAWRHSDGLATDNELDAAYGAGRAAAAADAVAAVDAVDAAAADAANAAWAAWAADAAAMAAMAAEWDAAWAAAAWAADAANAAWAAEWDAQRKKLAEILTAGAWVDDECAAKMESSDD